MDQQEKKDQGDLSSFDTKWQTAAETSPAAVKSATGPEEKSVYVAKGNIPKTQRQFSLFWYSDFIRQALAGKGYKKAIEIGCGRGTAALYAHLYDNMEMTLTDLSPAAVSLAQENFSMHGGKGEFIIASADALPFADGSFDAVFTIGLLEHFSDYSSIMKEMYRILRSGGTVVSLNIPKKHSVQDVNQVWRGVYHLLSDVTLKPDYYRNTDTPTQYTKRAEDVGFVDIQITYVNPFPLYAPAPMGFDRFVTRLNNAILRIRKALFRRHPFVTGPHLSQAHFLVARKP